MCLSPLSIRIQSGPRSQRGYQVVSVPCNNCYECVRRRKLDWEIRLQYEAYASDAVYFSLITYNELFYHHDIDYSELKLFFALLRSRLLRKFGVTMKYFLVSEYGETRDRLHYHALFFLRGWKGSALEFKALLEQCWVKRQLKDADLFHHELKEYQRLRYHWKKQCKDLSLLERPSKYMHIPLGFCSAQVPNGNGFGSISYCCKYIQKQYNKMYYSHLGYEHWINCEITKGRISYEIDSLSGAIIADSRYNTDYNFYNNLLPKVAIRGKLMKVPKSWLIRAIGKYKASYLARHTFLETYDPHYDKFEDVQLMNLNARFLNEERERFERLEVKSILAQQDRYLRRLWLMNLDDYAINIYSDGFQSENQFEHTGPSPVQLELSQLFYG